MGHKALGTTYQKIEQSQQGSFPFEKKTGDQRIAAALQRGEKITPMEAWNTYGIYRLSSVVHRLRGGKGHSVEGIFDISSGMVAVHNKFGDKLQVACYSL